MLAGALFDFGDEWVFDVTFIREVVGGEQEVLILGSRGKSPEQYPNYGVPPTFRKFCTLSYIFI